MDSQIINMEEGNLFPGSLDQNCTKPELYLPQHPFPSSNTCSKFRRRPSRLLLHRLRRCYALVSLSDAVVLVALATFLCGLTCTTDMILRPRTLAQKGVYDPSLRRQGHSGLHGAKVSQRTKPVPVSASELASKFDSAPSRPPSLSKVKPGSDEVVEGAQLQDRLVRSCRTLSDESRRTVWVVERQTIYSGRRSIRNTAEVVKAVRHVLHHHELADSVRVRVLHPSLNMQCAAVRGSGYSEATESEREFKDVSMLIAVAGLVLDNVSHLPEGSSVVEVLPFGVRGNDERPAVAKSVGVHFHQMWNGRDKRFERKMRTRFGDVAKTEESCWLNAECKAARLRARTKVEVHHLKMLLDIVLKEWRENCAV